MELLWFDQLNSQQVAFSECLRYGCIFLIANCWRGRRKLSPVFPEILLLLSPEMIAYQFRLTFPGIQGDMAP